MLLTRFLTHTLLHRLSAVQTKTARRCLITTAINNMSTKPKVYVTRSVNQEALDVLQETCDVSTYPGDGPIPRADLIANLPDKSALFCMLTDRIDSDVLNAAPNLKVIATMSVGYDHLSVDAIKQRNIKIGYTPDILTDATAELTVALLLATSRRLLKGSREARNGGWKAWSPFWMCGPGLSGATVGIVGFGRIGQEVAKRLQPFNVKQFLYHSRTDKNNCVGAQRVTFDELLRQSDFVVATCALTPETQGIFNSAAFDAMKKSAVFVNTSRGAVVDQGALIEALKAGKIWAAGLDVTTPEPLPLDSELFRLENCVVLPHIGSAAIETRKQMAVLTARNILAALKGEQMPAELVV